MKFANTNRTDNGEGKPLCTCILLCRRKDKNISTITDVEGRRLGERIGLDTLVVQAENYECYRLKYLVYK